MEIKEDHKALLISLGLKDEDFELFDGEFVRYDKSGSEEYRAKFENGKLIEKLL